MMQPVIVTRRTLAVIAIGTDDATSTARYHVGRSERYATAVVSARNPVNCLIPLHASATNMRTSPGRVIMFPSHRTGMPTALSIDEPNPLTIRWSGEARVV